MPFTLGKPGCPKCKGDGVFKVEDRIILRQDGGEVRYPQVARCSCLEKPVDQVPAPEQPDTQKRAAGDKE